MVATTNDITGDSIRSKSPSKQYEDNFDAIFRSRRRADKPTSEDTVVGAESTPDKPLEST